MANFFCQNKHFKAPYLTMKMTLQANPSLAEQKILNRKSCQNFMTF